MPSDVFKMLVTHHIIKKLRPKRNIVMVHKNTKSTFCQNMYLFVKGTNNIIIKIKMEGLLLDKQTDTIS